MTKWIKADGVAADNDKLESAKLHLEKAIKDIQDIVDPYVKDPKKQ